MAHNRKFKRLFLERYKAIGTIVGAAAAMQCDRTLHWDWLKLDPQYKAEFEAASDPVIGMISDEVHSRSIAGWLEPVFSGGKQATMFKLDEHGEPVKGADGKFVAVPAVVLRKSDACLLALAAARVPGFSQKVAHRITDEDGEDRELTITVRHVEKPLPQGE